MKTIQCIHILQNAKLQSLLYSVIRLLLHYKIYDYDSTTIYMTQLCYIKQY